MGYPASDASEDRRRWLFDFFFGLVCGLGGADAFFFGLVWGLGGADFFFFGLVCGLETCAGCMGGCAEMDGAYIG